MRQPLTCDDIIGRALIEGYVAGRLSETDAEALESHYLACDRCYDELRLATAIWNTLPEVRKEVAAEAQVALSVPGRRLGHRWKIGVAGLAAAAVLAGVLLLRPSDLDVERAPVLHREKAADVEAAPAAQVPIGEIAALEEFRWSPVTSADLYRVTVYDAEGAVIWEDETRETHAAPSDGTELEAGVPYLWEVAARVGWDQWVSSELVRFRISEP